MFIYFIFHFLFLFYEVNIFQRLGLCERVSDLRSVVKYGWMNVRREASMNEFRYVAFFK